MKAIFYFITLLICYSLPLKAQWEDHFSDSNFTQNPVWYGQDSNWIINAQLQLQSNNTTSNSSFSISTSSLVSGNAVWEWYVALPFNTSSTNYVDVYVMANTQELVNGNGYFVRLGNTADEICLYKRTGSSIIKLIDGIDGLLTSDNTIKIKLSCDANRRWTLYRDLTGTGNSYAIEGTCTDSSYTSSQYFGIQVKQSTLSFAQKHFFDDIKVYPYVRDTLPPSIIAAKAINDHSVELQFSEAVDPSTAAVAANYRISNNIGMAAVAAMDPLNNSIVQLSFQQAFTIGSYLQLYVDHISDWEGNWLMNAVTEFSWYQPQAYDVVIDEIMADPSPPVALPEMEWIELKNNSAFVIDIGGWTIGNSGTFPPCRLQPDSVILVCNNSNASALSAFGRTIGISSFPSLPNDGGLLILKDGTGNIMHTVAYNSNWYKNSLKANGGWSLEMMDTHNPCTGAPNWAASNDPTGGSPGRKNSVDALNKDEKAPRLLNAFSEDSVHVRLYFNEALETNTASLASNYLLNDVQPLNAVVIPPLFTEVILEAAQPFQQNKPYPVAVLNLQDCAGNSISSRVSTRTGLPGKADSMDIVINEILFNPSANGSDYVELYNRSSKIINLQQLYLANRNSAGIISNITVASTKPWLIFPGDYVAVTENIQWMKEHFITGDNLIEIDALPSYPDDKGNVVLLNSEGRIIDELGYNDNWHFELISNTEDVALERIDYTAATQLQDNWHSAAGNGTPALKNSQFRASNNTNSTIEIIPPLISPDNDGRDDFATIQYKFSEPGFVANISIFDATGRPVRALLKNSLCSQQGYFRWDGLGELGKQLPAGLYIIFIELFNAKGKKQQFKKTITLSRSR